MKTIITSRRAGAVLTGLAIAVVPAALALPTFTPVGPPNTSVTGMSGDGSVLVGQQSNGKYSYRWTREDGTEDLGGGKTLPARRHRLAHAGRRYSRGAARRGSIGCRPP